MQIRIFHLACLSRARARAQGWCQDQGRGRSRGRACLESRVFPKLGGLDTPL